MAGGTRHALRLMFVTPGRLDPAGTTRLVRAVLDGGATSVLLREPQLDDGARRALAADVAAACRDAGAALFVSRDLALAAACGADGVHLGHGGPTVAEARAALPDARVGRSCHWPPTDEDRAADHVTLSPFRPTHRSRPRPLLEPEQVAAVLADEALGPVVALGGLTAADVPDLPPRLAGVAVVRALADAADPRGAAAVLRSVVDSLLDFGGAEAAGVR